MSIHFTDLKPIPHKNFLKHEIYPTQPQITATLNKLFNLLSIQKKSILSIFNKQIRMHQLLHHRDYMHFQEESTLYGR